MAWTDSRVSRAFLTDTLAGTSVFDLDAPSDTYKLSLWNNTVVPDKDAVSANFRYGTPATFITANEVTDATNWVAGGKAITGMTMTNPATGVVMCDCNDVASGGNVTLTGFFGGMVYNDTKAAPVPKQGVCFNYFGGTQTVTANPFTAVIDGNGLFRITV